MRIGMICHNYVPHPGGLEVMVQNLVRGLARRHEVVLVASGWNGARGETTEGAVVLHRLQALHWTENLGVPYPIPLGPGLGRALRALGSVDLIHTHGALYASSILAASLAARQRKPLLLTEHVGFVEYRRKVLNAIQRAAWALIGDRIVRAADIVATYNTRVQDWLQKRHPQSAIRYVGNGVDVAAFRPRALEERARLRESFALPPDKILVLYAARASEKKNLDFVLRIPRDAFHLVVCGWRRGLRENNLTDLGLLPHARMPDLFGCVDLMVHASSGEGLPLAVQEGISSGVPLVLLWDEGYAGWISADAVAACRSLDELGRNLKALTAAPERRAELARRARTWAESSWSWEATVDAYEALYREALSRRAAHA